jgi:hypothetical protein
MRTENGIKDREMRVTPVLRAASVLVYGICFSAAWAAEDASSSRIAVEVWRHGDIGSTVKFADAVETEIYGAARFKRSTGKRPGTLVVSISTAVEQVEVASRLQSWYLVEFATADGKQLGTSSGACWTDELSMCAKRVLADAELAALRMGSSSSISPSR